MENQDSTLTQEMDLSDLDRQHQRIAMRAYELYESRGCAHGFDLQDWFQAEAEISGVAIEPEKAAAAGI